MCLDADIILVVVVFDNHDENDVLSMFLFVSCCLNLIIFCRYQSAPNVKSVNLVSEEPFPLLALHRYFSSCLVLSCLASLLTSLQVGSWSDWTQLHELERVDADTWETYVSTRGGRRRKMEE